MAWNCVQFVHMSNFYITTTLPYVNADPHIGFALEIIRADVIARYYRLKGDNVFFNTGTDEHGAKIYQKALEEGIDPKAYCDKYALRFHELKPALNLSYNNFIRTTDSNHIAAAQEFWRKCFQKGDIYKDTYPIKYCLGCELEKTDSELVDGRCPWHPQKEIEIIEEENYFFKFSKYQKPLLAFYKQNPSFVTPDFRMNEIVAFVKNGLQDFSISRLKSKMPWGVPVPDDEEHVMYVWFDALVNYVSALGWPENSTQFNRFWPGTQVAGKDNLRQQSAMWQAMLMSAGLPNSQNIFINGFITVDGQKMSKSLGNVINPFELVSTYGTDAVRYFLLSELSPFADGDFSHDKFRHRYNGDLANGLGNIVARIAKLASRVTIKPPESLTLDKQVTTSIEQYQFDQALQYLWGRIADLDKYINQKQPWQLSHVDLTPVMNYLVQEISSIAYNLQPFIPQTAEAITNLFKDSAVRPGAPLFPRLPEPSK